MAYPILAGRLVRVAGNANTMLNTGNATYNVGPLPEEVTGESAIAVPLNGKWAACLDPPIDMDQYVFRLAYSSGLDRSLVHHAVGAVRDDQNDTVSVVDDELMPPADTIDRSPTDTQKASPPSSTDPAESVIDDQDASSLPPSTDKLRDLRAKASAAASNNPVRDLSEDTIGSRYQRAHPIREYAKKRANGFCEACGEQAPFATEVGELYLEVHHVDELGKGGKDHPSKVVALCPTCHRRIHHGKDGQQINQAIREKLKNGLASVGE